MKRTLDPSNPFLKKRIQQQLDLRKYEEEEFIRRVSDRTKAQELVSGLLCKISLAVDQSRIVLNAEKALQNILRSIDDTQRDIIELHGRSGCITKTDMDTISSAHQLLLAAKKFPAVEPLARDETNHHTEQTQIVPSKSPSESSECSSSVSFSTDDTPWTRCVGIDNDDAFSAHQQDDALFSEDSPNSSIAPENGSQSPGMVVDTEDAVQHGTSESPMSVTGMELEDHSAVQVEQSDGDPDPEMETETAELEDPIVDDRQTSEIGDSMAILDSQGPLVGITDAEPVDAPQAITEADVSTDHMELSGTDLDESLDNGVQAHIYHVVEAADTYNSPSDHLAVMQEEEEPAEPQNWKPATIEASATPFGQVVSNISMIDREPADIVTSPALAERDVVNDSSDHADEKPTPLFYDILRAAEAVCKSEPDEEQHQPMEESNSDRNGHESSNIVSDTALPIVSADNYVALTRAIPIKSEVVSPDESDAVTTSQVLAEDPVASQPLTMNPSPIFSTGSMSGLVEMRDYSIELTQPVEETPATQSCVTVSDDEEEVVDRKPCFEFMEAYESMSTRLSSTVGGSQRESIDEHCSVGSRRKTSIVDINPRPFIKTSGRQFEELGKAVDSTPLSTFQEVQQPVEHKPPPVVKMANGFKIQLSLPTLRSTSQPVFADVDSDPEEFPAQMIQAPSPSSISPPPPLPPGPPPCDSPMTPPPPPPPLSPLSPPAPPPPTDSKSPPPVPAPSVPFSTAQKVVSTSTPVVPSVTHAVPSVIPVVPSVSAPLFRAGKPFNNKEHEGKGIAIKINLSSSLSSSIAALATKSADAIAASQPNLVWSKVDTSSGTRLVLGPESTSTRHTPQKATSAPSVYINSSDVLPQANPSTCTSANNISMIKIPSPLSNNMPATSSQSAPSPSFGPMPNQPPPPAYNNNNYYNQQHMGGPQYGPMNPFSQSPQPCPYPPPNPNVPPPHPPHWAYQQGYMGQFPHQQHGPHGPPPGYQPHFMPGPYGGPPTPNCTFDYRSQGQWAYYPLQGPPQHTPKRHGKAHLNPEQFAKKPRKQ